MKTTRYIKKGISFVLILSLMLQLFPHLGLFGRASASTTAGDAAAIVSADTLVSPADNTVAAEIPPTFIDQTQPLAVPAAAAAEPTSGAPADSGEDQQVFPTFVSSPYSYSSSDHERVAMNTGALTYESVDYVLPGINGLDLVIGHRYRSDDANVYTPKMDWHAICQG